MITLYDTVYRPPTEAGSLLLEISAGCSHGKCSFCRLSDGTIPLQLVPAAILTENLTELASEGVTGSRMYLSGENVLAFRTRYLLDVFHLVQSYLPQVREFAMYSRGDDVLRKTDDQLLALRDAGLDTLYIGVESGNDQVLRDCRKGETPRLILEQLQRLDRLGISYGLSSILGLGGTALWQAHERDTAALFSACHPRSIRVMSLTAIPGTPLAKQVEDGTFEIPSPEGILREELLLLENLDVGTGPVLFLGNHASNQVPVIGLLPQDQPQLIRTLRDALSAGGLPPQQAPKQW